MPTYEYRCKGCGEQLEVVQAFTDEALEIHEACGGELRKVFGSVGISFKGSGFYKNDSRGSSKSSATGGESASDSSSSSDSSTSSDNQAGSSTTDSTKGDSTKTGGTSPKKDTAPAASAK